VPDGEPGSRSPLRPRCSGCATAPHAGAPLPALPRSSRAGRACFRVKLGVGALVGAAASVAMIGRRQPAPWLATGVAIEQAATPVAELGRGEIVGEIAQRRGVPRTATARAVGTSELAALDRETLLLVVTGSAAAYATAHEQADRRLDDLDPPEVTPVTG
jgi:CRP-like cAMP-binding protein